MTTGEYLCAACARPGEVTTSVAGIGRCIRCPRRTGRQLVGAPPEREADVAPARATPSTTHNIASAAAPPLTLAPRMAKFAAPPSAPPSSDDLAERRTPPTAPPERGPVRFGPPLRLPCARG